MDFRKLLINRRIQLIIIVLVTLIAYINILQNGFAWDDRDFFIDWPQIKNTEGLPAYLSLPSLLAGDLPLNHRGIYRPLRSVYYLASYSIWGENPLGYHIQAIIVHTLIVIVIYLITEIITKKRALAFIVSLLFATHPIHTEAVTYTAASMDTLGILFFFLSFYFYLRIANEKYKKGIYLLASIIYAFFAFFTYEMTLVLPLLIILYDFCTNKFSFRKLINRLNIYKNYFLVLIVYFLIRFVVLGLGNRADYLGSLWQIVANQARVGMPEITKNYFFWLIWPVNLTVSHEIPRSLLYGFLNLLGKIDPSGQLTKFSTNIVFLLPLLYALVGIILSYIIAKKFPLAFFALAWLILTLLPVSNILPQGAAVAERFLYIPSFGFTLLLGLLLYHGFLILKKNQSYKYAAYLSLVLFTATLAFYSYQTVKRNQDWRDEKTIWQSAIKTDPTNPLPYGALGTVYVRQGEYDTGINLLTQNKKLSEPDAQINSNLGLAYEKKGETDKAIALQLEALKIDPQYYFAHVYLGNIYLKQEKYELAENEYKSALEINKDDHVILSYLGHTYYNQKKYDSALEIYQQAFNLNQNSDELALNIGLTLLKQSKYDAAILALNKSLNLNPRQTEAYLGLAEAFKQKGDLQKATAILKKGLSTTHNSLIQDELKLIDY